MTKAFVNRSARIALWVALALGGLTTGVAARESGTVQLPGVESTACR